MRNVYQFTKEYLVSVDSDGNLSMIPRPLLPSMLLDELYLQYEYYMDRKARLRDEYEDGDGVGIGEGMSDEYFMEEMQAIQDNLFFVRKQIECAKEIQKRENEKEVLQ